MAGSPDNNLLRSLPSVDKVLDALGDSPFGNLPHEVKANVVRGVIADIRDAVLAGSSRDTSIESVVRESEARLSLQVHPSLRRVINATGIVLHTNLGRSVLAPQAVDAVAEAARSYSNLEYSIDSMGRGSRQEHVERLICSLTGAEAAMAVNNNAAAVMMVLQEFAQGREAVISRGELIEIGGSFRIPEIMELSGARMVEVGTTNKTHLSDYEKAVCDDTAMLVKVHTSNYSLVGFTESVSSRELKRLAEEVSSRRANAASKGGVGSGSGFGTGSPLLLYEDLGSGMLLAPRGLEGAEPTVRETLEQGCDLVSFSGDKLLGGPQAGIIVGAKPLIDRLKRNPLARVLRLDKMTIAALTATLQLYLDGDSAIDEVPTLSMLSATLDQMRERALSLKKRIEGISGADSLRVELADDVSKAGGGSLPTSEIPTCVVTVSFSRGTAQGCLEHLVQKRDTPIIARIKHDMLVFDPRTLLGEDEQDEIAAAIESYLKGN
ncbi:MAG: L-seryl-tRNA(Sec) selenium transferase [Coriobacteriales bacterium]|jgi:L-seryl-tRNA(Ser) seleniumtransferase